MKKQTLKKLTIKKVQISQIENTKGGMHRAQTCLGIVCPETMFFVCPARN
ncbi:MAG: hypothetical protein AAF617_02465 [Bacteroidota bacterium]